MIFSIVISFSALLMLVPASGGAAPRERCLQACPLHQGAVPAGLPQGLHRHAG
jgi:hypothetical protein